MPRWWNGRHRGLKIPRPLGLVGSSPTRGTIGASSSGKTSDFDSDIRRFESFRPSHSGTIAQLVEQGPFKPKVVGSCPTGPTNLIPSSIG